MFCSACLPACTPGSADQCIVGRMRWESLLAPTQNCQGTNLQTATQAWRSTCRAAHQHPEACQRHSSLHFLPSRACEEPDTQC